MQSSEWRTSKYLAKPNLYQVSSIRVLAGRVNLPLASSSGGINDSLGGLDTTKAIGICSKSFIVSVGMKTTNVDIAIARNEIGQALIKSAHALLGSVDSRYCKWNSWMLLDQCINVDIDGDLLVWQRLDILRRYMLKRKLLRRWRGTKGRTIDDVSSLVVIDCTVVRGPGSRLVGGVGSATIVKSRNLFAQVISSVGIVSSPRGVRHGRRITGNIAVISSLCKVRQSRRILAVRVVMSRCWCHGLSRVHAGGVNKLTIGSVKHLAADRYSRRGNTRTKTETSELVEKGVHGSIVSLGTSAGRLSGGSTARVGLRVSSSLKVRHGDLTHELLAAFSDLMHVCGLSGVSRNKEEEDQRSQSGIQEEVGHLTRKIRKDRM